MDRWFSSACHLSTGNEQRACAMAVNTATYRCATAHVRNVNQFRLHYLLDTSSSVTQTRWPRVFKCLLSRCRRVITRSCCSWRPDWLFTGRLQPFGTLLLSLQGARAVPEGLRAMAYGRQVVVLCFRSFQAHFHSGWWTSLGVKTVKKQFHNCFLVHIWCHPGHR